MTDETRTELFREVITFARNTLPGEIDRAYEYFFDEDEPEDFLSGTALDLAFINFEDWFVCDHRTAEGDSVIDLFVRSRDDLGEDAGAVLSAMRDSFISLYEVVESYGDVVLRDLLMDYEFPMLGGTAVKGLNAGDVFASRFFEADGGRVMSRCVYPFGRGFKGRVLEYVNIQFARYARNKNADGTMKDFIKDESSLFNIIWINSLLSQQSGLKGRRQESDA